MTSKNESVEERPSVGNAMFLNKLYFRLYPSTHRKAINETGKSLQQWLLFLTFVHLVLFFTSFAFVGFQPMLINLCCFAFVFSAYRSMQECSMWGYFFSLLGAVTLGIFHVFTTKYGNIQFLFKIIDVVMYVISAIVFIKPWREYRLGGGFYSEVTDETLPDDVFYDWM